MAAREKIIMEIINLDTKEGKETALKEVARESTKREVKTEELYRFTLNVSPISFRTITDEQKQSFKDIIKEGVGRLGRGIVREGKLSIRMELFLGSDHKLSDVDNLTKCFLDLMQGIVYTNDKIVRHIDILRNEVSKGQITIIIAKYKSQTHRWSIT